jgi:hypothetical protein
MPGSTPTHEESETKRMRFLPGISAVILFAGCASAPGPSIPPTPSKPVAPAVNLTGYSPAFRAGYTDGCASVGETTRKRDEPRFKADPDYAQGWRDGNDICKRRK